MTSSEEPKTNGHANHAAPVAAKKPRRAAPRANAAPNAPKKATQRRKGATGAKKAGSVRKGTKTAKILGLLARPRGATVKEIMQATGWQPHSVRGFLSGVVSKQMRLKLRTAKDDSGVLRYAVKS